MGTLVALLIGVVYLSCIRAHDPTVTPFCPELISDIAGVEVKYNKTVGVTAYCKNNYTTQFQPQGDGLSYVLIAYLDVIHEDNICVFYRKPRTTIYYLEFIVAWSEHSDIRRVQKYMFTCTYSGTGSVTGNATMEANSYIRPLEQQTLMGPAVNSSFTLNLFDVENKVVAGTLKFGQYVRLKAVSNGASGELGIRAHNCTVQDGSSSYAILRAGCGDGFIFDRKKGFQTTDLTVLSPYFEMFRLPNSWMITFECTFIACNQMCNGDSCPVEMRKRNANQISNESKRNHVMTGVPGDFIGHASLKVFIMPPATDASIPSTGSTPHYETDTRRPCDDDKCASGNTSVIIGSTAIALLLLVSIGFPMYTYLRKRRIVCPKRCQPRVEIVDILKY